MSSTSKKDATRYRVLSDALASGIPGMVAMSVQVTTLMWLRTTVNYQYRHGVSMKVAMKTLYKDGGVPRFYRGILPALFQAPLSRFGDTAANAGTLSMLENVDMPIGLKTMVASIAAASYRALLMPIDTVKTTLQVEGNNGLVVLRQRIKGNGIMTLFNGSLASSAATFAGHYPWFFTYNYLNSTMPQYDKDTSLHKRLLRSAFIGFCASLVSDCCANSLRVVKTTRQTTKENVSYPEIVRSIVKADGVVGLLGRGLGTKIISNGIQGLLFSVAWRMAQDKYAAFR